MLWFSSPVPATPGARIGTGPRSDAARPRRGEGPPVSYLLRECREAAGGMQTFDLRYEGGVVVARAALEPAPGARVVDLGGAFVSPGLIDGHVHLGLGGAPEAAARASVAAGLTAVRDLGGMRNADSRGLLDAPGRPDAWGLLNAWG